MDPRLLDQLPGLGEIQRQRTVTAFGGSGMGANWGPVNTRTFQIASPRQTHTRPATCAEAGCAAYQGGFNVVCPPTPQGRAWFYAIRQHCRPAAARLAPAVAARITRRYVQTTGPDGSVTFTFPAGTPCFTAHRVSLERPELFIVRGGDVRGDPRREEPRLHTRPELWVEESAEHLETLAKQAGT